jgi:hypothetical protein
MARARFDEMYDDGYNSGGGWGDTPDVYDGAPEPTEQAQTGDQRGPTASEDKKDGDVVRGGVDQNDRMGAGNQTNTPNPPAGSTPDPYARTGDPIKDAILDLYKKYGVMPGQRGSGATDIEYWAQRARETSGSWDGYWQNRLDSILGGRGDPGAHGPESPAGPAAGPGAGPGASMAPVYNYYYQPTPAQNPALTYKPFQPDPRATALFEQLLSRAKQTEQISPDDPQIASQVNAFRAEQTRGLRNYLSGQAERRGPRANLGLSQRMGNEKLAQATGSLQAELIGRELQARRTEIQDALVSMAGMLSDEQKLALQKELAYLSNDQFGRQLGQQNNQFFAGLGQQESQFGRQLGQQNNQFFAGLGTQNDQFLRDLGLRAENQSSYWDAVRSGLLGG